MEISATETGHIYMASIKRSSCKSSLTMFQIQRVRRVLQHGKYMDEMDLIRRENHALQTQLDNLEDELDEIIVYARVLHKFHAFNMCYRAQSRSKSFYSCKMCGYTVFDIVKHI